MDIAKSLVKCVARGFYEVKHVLVLDALIIHNAVRDDELAKLLGLQTKDLHKLCGKLKEDRMLAVHTQLEQRENQQRPVNRTYYYIDYRATIDAVKYRMHKVVKEVEKKMNKDAGTKGYVCPRCEKRFTDLDIFSLEVDDNHGFICDRCANILVDDDDSVEVKVSQERLGRLMTQTKKIVEFLKKIDDVLVPANDWEHAMANAVPVPKERNQLTGAAGSAASIPVIKKLSGASQPSLEISITSGSEKTAAELAAEQLRKQQQAEKNALPVWHTESTVTSGAATNAGLKEAAEKAARERDGFGLVGLKEAEETKTETEEMQHQLAIANFYASLNAKDEEDEEEEEDDDDEEDEDEEDVVFEDVGTSAAPTPAAGIVSKPASVGGDTGSEEDGDMPPGKRQRTVEPSPLAQPPAAEEDSEEEADFEDV